MDPNPTTQRQRRVLRGLAGSTVAVILASVGHTLGGGGAPPWWLVVGVILLSLPITVWLVGRRLTVMGTAATVVAAQGLLHVTFASIGSTSAASPRAGIAQTSHHGMAGIAPAESAALASGASLAHLHADPAMIAAHLGAAAITIVLLLHGERLVAALARGWHRIAARIRVSVHLPVLPRVTPPPVYRPTTAVFLSAVSRRGPPALVR